MVSSTEGSPTKTCWKRRSSAGSFSTCSRNSSRVVAPTRRSSPRASIGLSMLLASMADSPVAPAPTTVCSSSMKVTTWPSEALISSSTALSRSSNSPRYFAPATIAPRSSAISRLPRSDSGTSPSTMRWASPSTTAVLPTPGSPISTGLFLVRRREHLHHAADLVVAADHRVEPALAGGLGEVGAVLREGLAGGLRVLAGHLGAPAQVVDLGLEGRRVALHGPLLEQGEEQHVGRQVGVAAGRHQRRGVLEHRRARPGPSAGVATVAPVVRGIPRQHRAGGGRHALRRAAGRGEQGGRGGALLLGERQGQVGGGDLGVAGGLRRALGDGQGLGHLGGGLQLHAGLSCDEVVGRGSSRGNPAKVESIPLNLARSRCDAGCRVTASADLPQGAPVSRWRRATRPWSRRAWRSGSACSTSWSSSASGWATARPTVVGLAAGCFRPFLTSAPDLGEVGVAGRARRRR